MLTIKQVAEELGLSVETIRKYIKDGKLDVIKINQRVYRVPKESVENLKNGK